MGDVTKEASDLADQICGCATKSQHLADVQAILAFRQAALATAQIEAAELRAELAEQARLVGMGAERELALRAEVERLRAVAKDVETATPAVVSALKLAGRGRLADMVGRMAVRASAAITGGTPHE